MNVKTFPRKFVAKAVSFTLGFTSIIGQVIVLRELIVAFYGNETAYAVILASWLFWIAVGSFVTGLFLRRIEKVSPYLGGLFIAVYVLLPLTILDIRFIKEIMHMGTGEIMGISPIFISSFLLLAPLTIILGSIFTFTCRFAAGEDGNPSALPAGMVYFWESVGAALGGLAFSFIFVHILTAIQMVFLVGFINIVMMVLLLARQKIFFRLGIAILAITLLGYGLGWVNAFDRYLRKVQWKNFDIVAITDSIYGNIALTKRLGEYSLFENGLLSFSTRDALSREEKIHYSLLEHPAPRTVLLIGNGLGGTLGEILKYPVERVDYVELDPEVVKLCEKYLPEEALKGLRDSRVHVLYTDARFYVKRSREKYDVIIVNCGDPYTAMTNRYYTLEFFREARRILRPQGILSLSVSSSENYISKETGDFLRSIHTTLRRVFPDVISIPGDTNIFIADTAQGVLTYQPDILVERLKDRKIQAKYVRDYYLFAKLSRDRVDYIERILQKQGSLNTDMHPAAYLYDIISSSTHFNLNFRTFVRRIQWVKLKDLMVFPVLLLVLGWVFRRRLAPAAVAVSIVTTGFSEIIFQVVVILAFQTLYGYAYYRIGLIMASFMGGLALGSWFAQRIIRAFLRETKKIFRLYRIIQAAICLYPVSLPFIFIVFRDNVQWQGTHLLPLTFALLPVIAGFIGGLQYPLATHLLTVSGQKGKIPAAQFAGVLYAADTFGATIGALLTGALLIPLLGIKDVVFFCAAVNLAVFILLLCRSYPASLSPVE